MTALEPQLSIRQRNLVRLEARDEYMRRRGDLSEMIRRAHDRVKDIKGKSLQADARAYAAELIRYWYAVEIDEPQTVAVPGEPRVGVDT